MEILVIGKPAVNTYLPLQGFPEEGDIFSIVTKNESLGNVAAVSACLLAKWKMSVHFTGVVGDDGYAELINKTFKEYNVDTHYVETNYEHGTATNTMILNVKTGVVTKVLYNNPEVQLQKYKYDFSPEFILMDGTDLAGTNAVLNNNASVPKVFYARKGDANTLNISKRCTYCICTQNFAEAITKEQPDGTSDGYVNLYQKIVDKCGSSNYIVILNNHKILYSVDGKVKMLPDMKINVTDSSSFDSVFVGTFTFAMANGVQIDDAIKLANTAAGISEVKIGEEPSIPSIDDVLDNSGLRDKLGMSDTRVDTPAPSAQLAQAQTPSVQSAATPPPSVPAQTAPAPEMPQTAQAAPSVSPIPTPAQSSPIPQPSATVNQAFEATPTQGTNE